MKKSVSVLLAGLLCLSVATAASAEEKFYVQVPGIPGASTDVGYTGWIEVLSFSLGFTQKACTSLSVMKVVDKTSPKLTLSAVLATVFPTVTLAQSSPSGGTENYQEYKVVLFDAIVTSAQQSGSSGGGGISESLSFQPTRVEVTYFELQSDGATTIPVTTTVSCMKR